MDTIENELAKFGIYHERDENTSNDYRHTLWQGECCLGRFDAREACRLLHDLRYGAGK